MDVYISGKISGKTQQEAEADFGKYAEIIQAAGHTPVNPMKNGLHLLYSHFQSVNLRLQYIGL